jgi:hypothetical protein
MTRSSGKAILGSNRLVVRPFSSRSTFLKVGSNIAFNRRHVTKQVEQGRYNDTCYASQILAFFNMYLVTFLNRLTL